MKRTSFQGTAVTVAAQIDTAYDHVKIVADEIEQVVTVADNLAAILAVDAVAIASSATTAVNAASAAATSETNAGVSAGNAATDAAQVASDKTATAADAVSTASDLAAIGSSVTDAQTAQAAAESALDQFDDIFLGPKSGNPTLDNDGDPLVEGMIYWNKTTKDLLVYNGTVWVIPTSSADATAAAISAAAAAADAATVATDKGIVAADKATVAADKGLVNTDKVAVAADLVQTDLDTIATAADRVQTGIDATATGNDKTATNADVVTTNADAGLTAADVVSTGLDVVSTGNDVTSAQTAKTGAETAQTASELALDTFTDIWLGAKASNPTLDNDGNALSVGALYQNTTAVPDEMRFYDGATWLAVPAGSSAPVDSVAGKTGVVTLVKADVGLGNVDNTTDTAKPVSTAGQTALDLKADNSSVGAANGIAPLDAGSKVPAANLPDSVVGAMQYQATWNATTNTPTIPAATAGNKGYYYKVSTAGSTNIDGITSWGIGDWVVSNGTTWDKIDNTDLVSSVAGQTGAVTLAVADISGAAPLASPAFTGTPTGITATHVGLGSVDNTADADKPVSTAAQTESDTKEDILKPVVDKGSIASGTATVTVSGGAVQKMTITGGMTLALTGWASTGNYSEVEVQITNGGSNVTLPAGVNWYVGDGTTSTTFADTGVTLNAAGMNTLIFWTNDGGTTIYGVAG